MRNEELSVAAEAAFYDDTSGFAVFIGYGRSPSFEVYPVSSTILIVVLLFFE